MISIAQLIRIVMKMFNRKIKYEQCFVVLETFQVVPLWESRTKLLILTSLPPFVFLSLSPSLSLLYIFFLYVVSMCVVFGWWFSLVLCFLLDVFFLRNSKKKEEKRKCMSMKQYDGLEEIEKKEERIALLSSSLQPSPNILIQLTNTYISHLCHQSFDYQS